MVLVSVARRVTSWVQIRTNAFSPNNGVEHRGGEGGHPITGVLCVSSWHHISVSSATFKICQPFSAGGAAAGIERLSLEWLRNHCWWRINVQCRINNSVWYQYAYFDNVCPRTFSWTIYNYRLAILLSSNVINYDSNFWKMKNVGLEIDCSSAGQTQINLTFIDVWMKSELNKAEQ